MTAITSRAARGGSAIRGERVSIVAVLVAGLLLLSPVPATAGPAPDPGIESPGSETWYARTSATGTPTTCGGFNQDLVGAAGASTTPQRAETGIPYCWYTSVRTISLESGTWQAIVGLHRGGGGGGGATDPTARVNVTIVSSSGAVEDTILSENRNITSMFETNMETFTVTGVAAKSLTDQRIRLSVEKTNGTRALNVRYNGAVGGDGDTRVVNPGMPEPLAADFTFAPAQPVAGEPVTFSATASGGTPPYAFAWTFGDGASGSGATVTHAFASSGTFTVRLNVADSAADAVEVSRAVVVTPPLSAVFAFAPTQPVVGEPVTFSATASGGTPPYAFAWTFGDGASGSGATVTHAFASPGTYTVTLTVSDSAGHTATVAKSITVTPALAADFTFSPAQPAVGEVVTFSATASGGTPPYAFAWTFGDGGTGSGPTVTHAFPSAGTFTVTLTVSDSAGHTRTVAKSITVASGFVADFTFVPTQPIVREVVTFSATASGGTPPYAFAWTFGDGSSGSGQVVTHAFLSPGTYTVRMSASDAGGRVAEVSRAIVVTPALTANFTFSPAQPVVGQSVSFSGNASGGTPPYAYAWDFGDGATGSGSTATHAFASPGTYTVILTVSDSAGHSTAAARPIEVILGLAADFTFAPSAPAIGETVSFSGSASGGTPPYTYAWDFGDGSGGSGQAVDHAFASSGTFTVVLTVSDSVGRVGTAAKPVSVALELAADFTFTPTRPVVGEVVTFSATASGGTPPYAFAWTFGDGATGAGPTASRAFASAGTFAVRLTASDAANHVAVVSRAVEVTPPLTADFAFTPESPLAFTAVTFSATASGGTPPYAFAWDFGDGGTGSGANASHVYAAAGTFVVALSVSDSAGHTATVSQSVAVSRRLGVDFTLSLTFPVIGETVFLSANASGGTPPYAYTWDFGDGATAFGATTQHGYAAAGAFAITLTAIDSAGHIAIVAKPIVVTAPLVVDLTFSPAKPMAGETITFQGIPAGATPPYTLRWTLGDGVEATGAVVIHAYGGAGNFSVNLTVSDSAGHNATASDTIPITPTLVAEFAFLPADPVTGEAVTFAANASGGTPPYAFLWDFERGATGAGPIADHAFGTAGSFVVTVTVSDSAGHALPVPRSVVVGPALAVNLAFSVDNPATGRKVAFTAVASGGTPPYTYAWDFGDGEGSQEANASHAYRVAGFSETFTVVLTVCDASGRCASVSAAVTAGNPFLWVLVPEVVLAALVAAYWIFERRSRVRSRA